MNFEASRAKAIEKLNNFIEKNLSEYSKLRNFDFGPDNRTNISCLSPYVTHGIINEKEIMNDACQKYSEAELAFRLGNSNVGEAIIGPHRNSVYGGRTTMYDDRNRGDGY